MSGVSRLPPEIWRMIIRYATSTSGLVSVHKEIPLPDSDLSDSAPCMKDDTPLTPVQYHRKPGQAQSSIQAFTQVGVKATLALVCRTFNQLVGEYLFEKLYISNPKTALRLAATLDHSEVYQDPGKWTRHITIIGVFFTYPLASDELAKAAVRVLSRTPHLTSFHLSWNATTKEFREREQSIIGAVPGAELRHFEWNCTGGGFERQPDHPFYQLLRSARSTIRVLKLTGYLPLMEVPLPSQSQSQVRAPEPTGGSNDENNFFPQLTHLKIRRAFRDDLLFISQWNISSHLTCLSFGSIWAYFDHRELAFSFWDTPKPALRCLHLGEGANVSTLLARKILRSAQGLRLLEYYYLGEWDSSTWLGAQHPCLEVVKVHVSHPVIALRSLFNNQRFSRDQQWDKVIRHISPFLGHLDDRPTSDSEDELGLGLITDYPAMKKLVFLEYARNSEDLQYDPAELVQWLQGTIREANISTNVELVVEVEDRIQ